MVIGIIDVFFEVTEDVVQDKVTGRLFCQEEGLSELVGWAALV